MNAAENINEIAEIIDIDLLPNSIQELVEVIGLVPALQLVDRFPGVPLYIPQAMTTDHPIYQCIGDAAAQLLLENYSGDTIRMPKLDNPLRQYKHATLKRMLNDGCSHRTVALRLGYSRRHVERLSSSLRNENQLDMFGE